MKKRDVSIHDVASLAGVSATTVSHALNGKGRVSEATRYRIVAAAEKLGYSANVHARGLASRRSMILSIQVSGYGEGTLIPGSAYFIQLLNGAAASAVAAGFALILAPRGSSRVELSRLPADGAVIVDPTGDEALLEVMSERGAPVVTTGRLQTHRSDSSWWVDNDHHAATTAALDHLWSMGYRRPAILTSARTMSYTTDSIRAYEEWAERHAVLPIIGTVAETSVASGEEAGRRLLRQANAPDSVYATTDDIALGLILAGRSLGLDIPDQLGVIAGSDTPLMQSATPAVTALDLQPARLGGMAIELLVRQLTRPGSQPAAHAIVPFSLMERESTRRALVPPVRDPGSTP